MIDVQRHGDVGRHQRPVPLVFRRFVVIIFKRTALLLALRKTVISCQIPALPLPKAVHSPPYNIGEMKNILILFITAILTVTSYAQEQYATTDNGRKVRLKADGTWEYVKNASTPAKSLHTNGNKSTATNTSRPASSPARKSAAGRTYIRGPRGGCYYINSRGNKTYVDRSLCN